MANEKKAALRGLLLEKRDGISHDLMEIDSGRIHGRLNRIRGFRDATRIGVYYPTGSEVPTQKIIQEAISRGLEVCLPKVIGGGLEFRRIAGFESLEHGSFDLMEPKDGCPAVRGIGAMVIPAVGASEDRYRMGYGRGFYDRYLAENDTVKIALCFQRQIIRSIPREDHDVRMDYVVTEERVYGQ